MLFLRFLVCGLALVGLLSSCALVGPLPPQPVPSAPAAQPPPPSPGTPPGAPQSITPFQGAMPPGAAPPQPPQPSAPQPRRYQLGPASAALVEQARVQEQSHSYALAAETLERALSIEPHNPLVWIELGRENILANKPSQAYGMGRKALYLASGDPRAQASAWELIAAALREQGRSSEAYAAQERAVALSGP